MATTPGLKIKNYKIMIKTKYGEQEESLKIERKKSKPQRVS